MTKPEQHYLDQLTEDLKIREYQCQHLSDHDAFRMRKSYNVPGGQPYVIQEAMSSTRHQWLQEVALRSFQETDMRQPTHALLLETPENRF